MAAGETEIRIPPGLVTSRYRVSIQHKQPSIWGNHSTLDRPIAIIYQDTDKHNMVCATCFLVQLVVMERRREWWRQWRGCRRRRGRRRGREGGVEGEGEVQTNVRAFLKQKEQRNTKTVIVRPTRLYFFLKLFKYPYLVPLPCCNKPLLWRHQTLRFE